MLKATYTYDDNGNRQSLTYANGNSTVYDYNLANKLKTITNYKGTAILSKYDYTYYLDGNQAGKTDNTGKITSYTYDGLGRLTSESPTGEAAVSYTYDDYNNRAVMTVSGGAITYYGYDKNNRLQSEVKTVNGTDEITYYSYDDNGNQIYKSTGTLKPVNAADVESISISVSGESPDNSSVTISQYDGFNQLINTTVGDKTVTYTYDADGLRVSKTVNGAVTQHVWDGDQIALELDGLGNVTSKYVRGINLIYAEASGAVKYYLFNGHGDVVQLTGNDGSVTKSYDYDAFGNEKNPNAADTNVFRYCGEYFDLSSGTYYLRARYYDPEIGRFISEDSVWGKDKDPLSLNLYTYCSNDPIIMIDPSGHIGLLPDGSIYMAKKDTEIDFELLVLKQEYLMTKDRYQKQKIADQADQLRIHNPGKWHVSAEKSLDYYKVVNITDKLNKLMLVEKYIYQGRPLDMEKFYNLVKNGAKYDLKNQPDWQHEQFIYNGKVIDKDVPGNINYGFLGKVFSIPDFILKSAAGLAQIEAGTSKPSFITSYGDDPRDQKSIQQGIEIYNDWFSGK